MKAALIGCGALALLCVLAFVGIVLYAKKNPGVFLDVAMSQIEKNYGPDVTEADRAEVRKTVAEFKEAIRSGKLSGRQGSPWSYSMRQSTSGKLSHEDVQRIIRSFREAMGQAPAEKAAPAVTPAAVRTPA